MLTRREFLRAALAAGTHRWAGVGALAGLASTPAIAARTRPLIKPPRLKRGDTIALVAIGGVVDDAAIEKSVRNIESLGFKVQLGQNLRARQGGYAGTVPQRLADLHSAFADRSIQGIWAGRGGSGTAPLLPHLNLNLIRSNPKPLVGFSDITALHLALNRAGLVSFHGPTGVSTFSDYSKCHLESVLMDPAAPKVIESAPENLARAEREPAYRQHAFKFGVAEGPLIGGNLAVLTALVGTPHAARFGGALLFLEEINEAPYRVDRMLTQLDQNQGLARAAGVALGVFRNCEAKPGDASLSLHEVLDSHFGNFARPAIYGLSFGHIAQHFTMPYGVRARLDTRSATLTLLESAVV